MSFFNAGKEGKMSDQNTAKNNGAIKEIAEILANGILRMKKKGKLKGALKNQ
jgi:hypothetical protein